MFGQGSAIRPADVVDGLSQTASMSEKVRGHDDFLRREVATDVFRYASLWTQDTFRRWCRDLSDQDAALLDRNPSDTNSGHTWLEGNMT